MERERFWLLRFRLARQLASSGSLSLEECHRGGVGSLQGLAFTAENKKEMRQKMRFGRLKSASLALAFVALISSSVFLCACGFNQLPKETLQEAVKAPANSGTTVSSEYVQEPTYMHEPAEWSVVKLDVKEETVEKETAEVVSESTIRNDSFEISQNLKQKFKKQDDKWVLDGTEVIDASAKALSGINYAPTLNRVSKVYLPDLPDAEVVFNENEQTCEATYPVGEDDGNWLVAPSGFLVTSMSFDGFKWTLVSQSLNGAYTSQFTGFNIDGRRPNTTESAFDYYLGSDKSSDSYDIFFESIEEDDMSLTLSWSGTRSTGGAMGGSMGLIYGNGESTSSFDYSAQYSGQYTLGNSTYYYGEEESFVLRKDFGDSSMPAEITCTFTYPSKASSTRVLTISWSDGDGNHQVAFDLTPA